MNPIIDSIVLSLLPISELRGGIPVAIARGINPWIAFLVCIVANFLVIPIVFFFLDHIHQIFMKLQVYKNLFNKYIENKRSKLEKYIGTKWEFIALMLFVGIPLPITGAYTGTLLAWFFKVPRKKAYKSLSLGILIAGTIVTIVTILGIKALTIFIKT